MASLMQAATAVQERSPLLGASNAAASAGFTAEPSAAMVTRTAALTPRPTMWPARSLTCLAGAAVGYAAAPYAGYPSLSLAAAALGGATSLQQAVSGARNTRRTRIADDLTEALTPLLGLRKPSRRHVMACRWKPAEAHGGATLPSAPDGGRVTASRWNGWWVGSPQRVKLVYARGVVNAEHPRWKTSVLDTTARLLGCEYTIVRHDAHKGVVHLRKKYRDQSMAPELELDVLRAERLVRSLLGPGASITPYFDDLEAVLEADDDALSASEGEDEGYPLIRQIVALDVHHQAGTRISTPAQRARVERSMSAMMPGRWRARFHLHQDHVRFELRPAMPQRVPSPPPLVLDTDPLQNYDDVKIPFAVDEDADSAFWRPAIDPHLMVIGPTGTGKTVLLHNVVARFAAWGWPVHIVDGKAVEFLGFREWPNVQTVATFVDEQVALIHAVWQIMEDRYAAVVAGEAMEVDFEPVVLVLDEFRDFIGNLTNWYGDIRTTGRGGDPAKPPVLEKVKSIARKGRTARVHLVMGLQRPDAEFLSGEMRDNFRARVALGRLSPQASMMMWDSPTAAVAIPRIRGRGTTLTPHGNVVEVQTFWTPDPRKVRAHQLEDLDILRSLRPDHVRHERLIVISPTPQEKGNDEEEIRYHQWANPYFQPSMTAGVGARSSEHLRYTARIIPLQLRPDLATRSLLSPALAAEWLPDDLASSPAHGNPAAHGDWGEAVSVEADPRAGRYIAVTAPSPPRGNSTAIGRHLALDDEVLESDDLDEDDDTAEATDPTAGYGEPVDLDVDELAGGYLVLVDEDTDHWATLEDAPEEDIDDPDLRRLEWRDDDDDSASLTVDAGTLITARIPLDDEPAEASSPTRRNEPRPTGARRASPRQPAAPPAAEARPQRVRTASRRPPTAAVSPGGRARTSTSPDTSGAVDADPRKHLRLIR